MSKLTYPDLEHCPPRYVAECVKCGEKGYKRDMTSIHAKNGSHNPQKLCHVCQRCFASLLDELGVSMPEEKPRANYNTLHFLTPR